jgi:hypothetical protein
MQSKFFNVDDWETVDVASTGIGIGAGMADPASSIGFSIFMSGEAGTPVSKENDPDEPANTSGSALAGSPSPSPKRSKGAYANKNIFIGMAPPKPSWVQENY